MYAQTTGLDVMVKVVVCMSVGTGGAEESDKISLASALAHSLIHTQPD